MTAQYGHFASGRWVFERESNYLDGGAPWYNVYETKDNRHISVAPVEAKFYVELVRCMGLDPADLPDQLDRDRWPEVRRKFADVFRSRTRDEWCAIMEGHEACFAPVLSVDEATKDPHAKAREMFVTVDGVLQPAPAPRFSRTPSHVSRPPPESGRDTREVLAAWGFSTTEIEDLRGHKAIG